MRTTRIGVVSAIVLIVCISALDASGTGWGIGVVAVGVVSSTLALVFGEERMTDPLKSVKWVAVYAFVGTTLGVVASVIVGSFLGVIGEGEGWGYLIPGLLLGVIAALAASVTGAVLRRSLSSDIVNRKTVAGSGAALGPFSLPYAGTVVKLGKLCGGVVAAVTAIMGVVYWFFASLTAHWAFRPHRDQFFTESINSLPGFVVVYGEQVVAPIFDPFVSVTFGSVVSLLILLGGALLISRQYVLIELGYRLYLIPIELLKDEE
jgi:hypothetical protein